MDSYLPRNSFQRKASRPRPGASGLSRLSPDLELQLPGIREAHAADQNKEEEDAGMPRDLMLPHNPFHLTEAPTASSRPAPSAKKRKKLRT